jgi:membrane-associated HD superfamily phosphohydrolase
VLKRYLIWTISLVAVIFGATTAACFGSEYLSKTNITLASNSLTIVVDMFKNVSLWKLITLQVQYSFGWHWFCASLVATLLLLIALAARASRHSMRPEDLRFLSVLAVLCLGVIWWVKFAGPAQIRYLYPFAMIFMTVLLPATLTAADLVLPRWARRALVAPCVAPMAIITALLFMGAPLSSGSNLWE